MEELLRTSFHSIIPIGRRCGTTQLLVAYKLRYHAYPFDTVISTLRQIAAAIRHQFKAWLETDCATAPFKEYEGVSFLYAKNRYGIETPHFYDHDLTENPTTMKPEKIEAENRRTKRFLDLLKEKKPLLFLAIYQHGEDQHFSMEDLPFFENVITKTYPALPFRILCLVHHKNPSTVITQPTPRTVLIRCPIENFDFFPPKVQEARNPLFKYVSKLKVSSTR